MPLSIGLLTIMDKTIYWLDSWSKAESLADEMDRKSKEDNTVRLMIYAERWSWRTHSHKMLRRDRPKSQLNGAAHACPGGPSYPRGEMASARL